MSWTDNMKPRESLAILGTLSEVCGRLGGPVTNEILCLVRNSDYISLVNYNIDYSRFTNDLISINDAIYARQILGFFQKLDFLELGFQRDAVAAERLALSEQMCRDTNRRLKLESRGHFNYNDPRVPSVLFTAKCKISSILGAVPDLGKLSFAFGPGANTNVKGSRACPRAKLGVPLACSSNLTPTVAEFLYEVPHWSTLHAVTESLGDLCTVNVVVDPGKVIFVPKNAKTDRSIVVEPLLNSFFQKGFGSYIRDRLMRSGIDLTNQTRNQELARIGSVDGSLSTVDLSMASDCLSRQLVYTLLPPEWVDILDRLRTPEVSLPPIAAEKLRLLGFEFSDDRPYYLEKFSSMGNGYTFELESLIFFGICAGVCEALSIPLKNVSVYGDDLIIPTEAYPLLREVLSHCGFVVNSDKSFCDGPFRESCGADYLYGFDIRPFYLKTQVSERILFTMHNWFIRHCERELAENVLSITQPRYRLFGPDGYGDGHLIGSHVIKQSRNLRRLGWCGGYFETYALRPRLFEKPLPGDRILPIYSVYTRSGELSATDPNVVRGSCGYAKISIYTLSRSIFSSGE